MPITRDADYPPENAALFQAMNRAADGHDMLVVLDVAMNFAIAALNNFAREHDMDADVAEQFVRANAENLVKLARSCRNRESKPDDVVVPLVGH